MSRRRTRPTAPKTPLRRDALDGWPLCRWCAARVPSARHTFCSAPCVHEWKMRSSPSYARKAVFARDKGFCHDCGEDTERLRRSLKVLSARARGERLAALGIPLHRSTFWDMHHVLAVAEGGGECGLDNLITLCVPCHRGRTSASLRVDKTNPQ